MHKVADTIEAAVRIPLFHIADPTAIKIKQASFKTVGLLGTRVTMEQNFYRDRLCQLHELRVLIPRHSDREIVHRVIYQELCLGKIVPDSRSEYFRIMAELALQDAEAIILGCTEKSLLVDQQNSDVPLFDTTSIHALGAAELAMSAT